MGPEGGAAAEPDAPSADDRAAGQRAEKTRPSLARRVLGPQRVQRLKDAADQLPPPAHEVAVATLAGAPLLVLVNAVSIAVVPLPVEGAGLRALHHLFAAVSIVGVSALLALAPAVAPRVASRWRVPRARTVGWSMMLGLSVLAMLGVLSAHLRRQAYAAFDGVGSVALFPLYVGLTACAVPAAYLLGAFLARLGPAPDASPRRWLRVVGGWGAWVGVVLSLGGMVVGHAILRDDYPGVHTAILWISTLGFGSSVAPAVMKWGKGKPRRARASVGVAAALAAFVLFWPPANRVRQELFREPGAIAPWVLAQILWRPPSVMAAAEAPRAEDYPDAVMKAVQETMPAEPVVVIVTVDAFRGDVVANHANDRRLPKLSWLRDHGAYFPRAIACGSQTSLSLSSMFSGRYFSQLRWGRFGEGNKRFLYPAHDQTVRFPELLGRAGVATASYIGLVFLEARFGITRGFGQETVVVEGRNHGVAASVLGPLLARLNSHRRGPLFLYAHLMEPHEPYDRGKLKEGPVFERYLSELEVVDDWVGRVSKVLSRRFRGRGFLMVSSDHGEAFGEHGTKFHTKTLYEELLHVPLIVWGPEIPARAHDERASLIDIGPTVLHMFRQATPAESMGRSLLPLMLGRAERVPRPLIAEGRLRRAYYKGELKVIEDEVLKLVEIYDLESDPGETTNLFDIDPERTHPAVAELRAWLAENTLREGGYEPPYKP